MTKSTPLTLEERKQLEAWKDSDKSTKVIAKLMGRHERMAQKEYARAGGRYTYNAEKAHESAQKRLDLRKISNESKTNNETLRFTFEERKKLEEMKDSPLTGSEIARVMNRHKNVVNGEYRNGGGRKHYNADAAQKAFLGRHQSRYDSFKRPLDDGCFAISDEELYPNLLKSPIEEYARKIKEKNPEINVPPPRMESSINFPKLPLKIWIDRYKEEFAAGRKFWGKERRYFEFWAKHVGNQIATDIHPLTIEALADKLMEKEYKPGKFISESTRQKFLMYLSVLYSTAIEQWKWAVFNPVTCVRRTEKRKPKIDHNSAESVTQLVALKKDFVEIVKRKVKEEGLTQRDAARRCGISLNCWQHGMNPEQNTVLKNFVMICNGFGLKIKIEE